MAKTFYDVLELNSDADIQQIKTNYRRLVKKCHPDLNPGNSKAAEQFRVLQEAYETLADAIKRRAYDSNLREKRQEHYSSAEEFYDDWFGVAATAASARPTGTSAGRNGRRRMTRASHPRNTYTYYRVELTIKELFKGARRTLTVAQTHTCGRCRGSGVLPSNGKPCLRCGGFGFMLTYENVEVSIPPGVMPDMSIRIEMSHWQDNTPHPLHMPFTTDIYVTINLIPDQLFRVEDNNLFATVKVPAETLKAGTNWTLPAPEGGEISFKIPPETASGTTIKLRRQGLINGASMRRGNLYCTVEAAD